MKKLSVVKYSVELTQLDRLALQPVGTFAKRFSHLAFDLRSGKVASLSEKQIALIGKLTDEFCSELK